MGQYNRSTSIQFMFKTKQPQTCKTKSFIQTIHEFNGLHMDFCFVDHGFKWLCTQIFMQEYGFHGYFLNHACDTTWIMLKFHTLQSFPVLFFLGFGFSHCSSLSDVQVDFNCFGHKTVFLICFTVNHIFNPFNNLALFDALGGLAAQNFPG